MNQFQNMEEIVKSSSEMREIEARLSQQTNPMVVMFVDLAGSTRLKQQAEQAKWLPAVALFAHTVTKVVEEFGGSVVKYIGDEVMAVFDGDPEEACARAVLSTNTSSEHLFSAGSKYGVPLNAKYALDWGKGASVLFARGATEDTTSGDESGDQRMQLVPDVLGTFVDRCARIAKLCKPGTKLASEDFVRHSHDKRWKSIGRYSFKGLHKAVKVFQLDGSGDPVGFDPRRSMTVDELIARIEELEQKNEARAVELKAALEGKLRRRQ